MTQQVTLSELKNLIATKKYVFVDFFTSWCYPCGLFAERVDKEVQPMLKDRKDAVFVKLILDEGCKNIPEVMEFAQQCGMEVVPTTAVFIDGQQASVTYTDCRSKQEIKSARVIRGNAENIKTIVSSIIH